ncbi:MAG: hypothetical protein JWM99_3006 [Verrucomicrobiales bacterium]|jgi:ElaB/YqjD/DUF883 family membrane-anchored ribosome-binding protein|nr:hypothetical protein [Verrucomicrobiales bacterium]
MDATNTADNLNNQLEIGLDALSAQIEAGIESGKYTLAEIKALLREKSSQAAQATQEYVEANPWKLMLAGGLLGLALGLLTRRCGTE